MAWWRRQPTPELIFHSDSDSDSGSQYGSGDFQQALNGWGMRSSMSQKGNGRDNAPSESFWGRLKTASVHGQKFAIRELAEQAVYEEAQRKKSHVNGGKHSKIQGQGAFSTPPQAENCLKPNTLLIHPLRASTIYFLVRSAA